jgi:hypothetical protein
VCVIFMLDLWLFGHFTLRFPVDFAFSFIAAKHAGLSTDTAMFLFARGTIAAPR